MSDITKVFDKVGDVVIEKEGTKEKLDGILTRIYRAVHGKEKEIDPLKEALGTKKKKKMELQVPGVKAMIGAGIVVLIIIAILSVFASAVMYSYDTLVSTIGSTFAIVLIVAFMAVFVAILVVFFATSAFKRMEETEDVSTLIQKSKDAYQKK
jgi:uncharacterized membrane protein